MSKTEIEDLSTDRKSIDGILNYALLLANALRGFSPENQRAICDKAIELAAHARSEWEASVVARSFDADRWKLK